LISKKFGIEDERGYGQLYKPTKAVKIRTGRRVDYMLGHILETKGKSVLEIGCGIGEMAYQLASKSNAKVIGSDISAKFIKEAKKNHKLPNLSFEVMDFNQPGKMMKRKFDFIVGNGILHHLYYNLDSSMANIQSLLNRNGKIVFIEPSIINPIAFMMFRIPLGRKLSKLEPCEMAFTKGYVRRSLMRSGFSNIRISYGDMLLPVTPTILIKPTLIIEKILKHIPVVSWFLSQSLFITAEKNNSKR
jgi:2-polyprenyl-3-methyl-5-hydroxy-6-metoxy-1,4-benzoquinol methylase